MDIAWDKGGSLIIVDSSGEITYEFCIYYIEVSSWRNVIAKASYKVPWRYCYRLFGVDIDRFSYYEFVGYVKEIGFNVELCIVYMRPPKRNYLVKVTCDRDILGIVPQLKNGDIVQLYMSHLVDESHMVPKAPSIEYISHVGRESSTSFEKESNQDCGVSEKLGFEDGFVEAATPQEPFVSENLNSDAAVTSVGECMYLVLLVLMNLSSAPSASTVEKSSGSGVAATVEQNFNSDGGGVAASGEHIWEFRKAITMYAVQEHVELDKYVNEPKRVRVKCIDGCPWWLFENHDSRTGDFQVKKYNPVHICNATTKNKLVNSKYLVERYRDRIISDPGIRVFQFQNLVKKKLEVYIGRTVVRKARNIVLQQIMGDHVQEFKRILDYKDELLKTNPGSTCVVKLSEETFEEGKK
ncbi:uncharacterized protein LOC124896197 [Capsicum annuum]|uniref:uncharacterized protein LOC124896197 n=1 Tax=Capsicum annuum TaxID=4072 RepID=UPI001FB178C6|nr:uncharacterized protein LOC124896197 [Capsicum annuum]